MGLSTVKRVTSDWWRVEEVKTVKGVEPWKLIVDHLRGVQVIAIDAPLTPPMTLADPFRRVEKKVIRLHRARLLPLTLPGMRSLMEKGISLRAALEEAGIMVLETHPATAVKSIIKNNKFFVYVLEARASNKHELDSLIAAVTAVTCLMGRASIIKGDDGVICLPSSRVRIEHKNAGDTILFRVA